MSENNETDLDMYLAIYHVDFELSPVKKEKLLKERKQALREKLRADLPVLTAKEIRRCRLPHHEALLVDLAESGHIHTAEFIRQLFVFQEKNRKKFGPGTTIWQRPQLITSTKDLDLLCQGLTKAEKAHNSNNFTQEWEEIIHLAAHYAFGSDDWWWLGEQLLYQCVSMNYTTQYSKQETISHYIIGKYLVEHGTKKESGTYYLDLAREASQGKSWNCKKILKTEMDTVFTESCKLLYMVMIEEAKALLLTDPRKAIELCTVAKKRAVEACDHQGELDSLLLMCKCNLKLNETGEAIGTIRKTLTKAIRRKYVKGICEAKISLALAYLQHGKKKESLECLQELKNIAEENNLPFYEAQAYRFMGEYHLHEKQPYEATPLLMLAFYIFHENKDLSRREKVRTWAAISAGEELFPAYVTLIKKCDGSGSHDSHRNLMTLIEWLDDRKFFWEQESKFSFSFTSLKTAVE